MATPPPRDLARPHLERLLAKTRGCRSFGARIDLLSGLLLGRPYVTNPLVGSAEDPEVFTASLEGFDCVTYVETVLALSLVSRPADFAGWLRRIRYDGGHVEWRRRNHYMTDWIRSNARLGIVRPIRAGALAVRKERLLDVVPGLAPRRTRFSCIPKALVGKLAARLRTGDLVFFASTRRHLDVFHAGILVQQGGRLRLRHAARSRQGVVEQDLDEFLESNRMAGVIVVHPANGHGEPR